MTKVLLTFNVDADDSHRRVIFQPCWLSRLTHGIRKKGDAVCRALDTLESLPHEERTREQWEAIMPPPDVLDAAWARDMNTNGVHIIPHIRSFLPIELYELLQRIELEGPHRVVAPASMQEALAWLLMGEAEMQSDRGDYELSVLCGALRGQVE